VGGREIVPLVLTGGLVLGYALHGSYPAQPAQNRQCTHREAPQAVLRKRTFAHVLQQVAKPPVTALHRAVAIALALQQVCATKPYRTILDVWWGDPKKPYVFELANGNPIDFAGLWDALKDREGHWLQSFAIVTTEANELMTRVHPRTPVILHPRDYDRWLDREQTEQLPVDLLRPLDSDEMEMFEANLKVGNVRNNGPELMRAAVVAAEDGALPL
jgi:hypothetical protein